MQNNEHNKHESTPYILGRRGETTTKVDVDVSIHEDDQPQKNILQPIGWGALTFGAGAMLGWLASTKKLKP